MTTVIQPDVADLLEAVALGEYPKDVFVLVGEIAEARVRQAELKEENEVLLKALEANLSCHNPNYQAPWLQKSRPI